MKFRNLTFLLSINALGWGSKAPIPSPVPSPTPSPSYTPIPVWEFNGPGPLHGWIEDYSQYLRLHMPSDVSNLDLKSLCGKEPTDRVESVVRIFHAISYAETAGTNYDRTLRFVEKGIKTRDMVTHEPNVSEGLLQVSYQDSKLWGCPFDWKVDKNLSRTDPKKTIFNAFFNLQCGLSIMYGVKKTLGGNSFQDVGRKYWSTLRPFKKNGKPNSGFANFKFKLKDLGGCK